METTYRTAVTEEREPRQGFSDIRNSRGVAGWHDRIQSSELPAMNGEPNRESTPGGGPNPDRWTQGLGGGPLDAVVEQRQHGGTCLGAFGGPNFLGNSNVVAAGVSFTLRSSTLVGRSDAVSGSPQRASLLNRSSPVLPQ